METEFNIEDKSYLPFDPYANSRYSRYEEEVLIDPFLRPPICLLLISTVAVGVSIALFVYKVDDVSDSLSSLSNFSKAFWSDFTRCCVPLTGNWCRLAQARSSNQEKM